MFVLKVTILEEKGACLLVVNWMTLLWSSINLFRGPTGLFKMSLVARSLINSETLQPYDNQGD